MKLSVILFDSLIGNISTFLALTDFLFEKDVSRVLVVSAKLICSCCIVNLAGVFRRGINRGDESVKLMSPRISSVLVSLVP